MEEGTLLASKSKVPKVDSDEKDSEFDCYNKSDRKPVQVDIDEEVTEGGPALALQPNKSGEEEINNNGETMGGNGNISVRRSNRTFKPTDRLGSVPYF